MPTSIEQTLASQFDDRVQVIATQMKSRLRDTVMIKPVSGYDFSHNNFEEGQDTEITARNIPRTTAGSVHSTRWGKIRMFEFVEDFADYDTMRSALSDSTIQANLAAAAARKLYQRMDRIIVEALDATVITGRDKDGTLTFAQDGGITVAANGVGYTFDKVKEVKTNFINNDVGNDMPIELYTVVTGNQIDNFYEEDELVGRDFNSQLYIEKGDIQAVMGMNVRKFGTPTKYSSILSASGGVRTCFAYAKDAVVLGMTLEPKSQIYQRVDLQGSPWQIAMKMYMGAIRTQGKMVQKILCAE